MEADRKAPRDPRPARAAATAAVQDVDPVDLSASTFRPPPTTSHPVLADLEQTQLRLAELQAPMVALLQSRLQRLHETGSLGSYAANAQAAATVYRLAKSCGLDLMYKGEPVALSFSDSERYKTGVFRLRTFSGKPKLVYDRTGFPPLELAPVHDCHRRGFLKAAHNPE